ncbi:hypothetical protein R3W88_033944 [Solanum pinnatisectum]|uniref:Uncharacterized protein n=1 Tax=Solanum pinnatisectum TaxID=50273 RepID=A0AAV9JZR4_9SOLN|nr:hypothetical protein R3W88_033944 [Solanum pinnatisectum]
MTLSSNDGGNRRREICMKLENLRHHLRDNDALIQDARLRGRTRLFVLLLLTRRNAYLRREAELENELETYYNTFYRRYL